LNFIFGLVCLFVCVCAFSLRRESPDMILGDKPLISEVVLSHTYRPATRTSYLDTYSALLSVIELCSTHIFGLPSSKYFFWIAHVFDPCKHGTRLPGILCLAGKNLVRAW
jgi:hypothetical protein